MRLTLLLETVKDLISKISSDNNISDDMVLQIVNKYSPNTKFNQFIIRQWAKHNIRLPEDGYRVKEALENFITVRGKLQNKDLLSYKKLSDLEEAMAPFIGLPTRSGDRVDPTRLPGVKLYKRTDDMMSVMITNVDSLKKLGEGTKWCTRGSYPDCQADRYMEMEEWIGQIWKDNKPIVQYTPDLSQCMDVNDNYIAPKKIIDMIYLDKSTPLGAYAYARHVIHGRFPEGEDVIATDYTYSYLYASNIIKKRFYKGEKAIMSASPDVAYSYAFNIIGGRFPEAEKIIASDAVSAYGYAQHIIKGRFPECEKLMASDPHYAYLYAFNIIKGRFPEGEESIASNSSYAASYAVNFLDGRWPAAEKTILQDLHNPDKKLTTINDALKYATYKGRWPELEKIMLEDPAYAYAYARDVIRGRWPEAEPIIAKDQYSNRMYTAMINDPDH